jgi:hypothetical protein
MTDSPARTWEGTLAFLTLRIWLGIRCLVAGLEKWAGSTTVKQPLLDEFGEPDISGAMVEVKQKVYALEHYQGIPEALIAKFKAEPLLPDFALGIYGTVLGPMLVLLGVTLLLGILPRVSLFLTGLVFTSLTVGLMLIKADDGVAWLGIHIALVAMALALVRQNRFALFNRF